MQVIQADNRDGTDTIMGFKKVLIVDDDEDVRGFVREILEGKYMVLEAGDGIEALEMFLSEKPDAVITDNFMPRMTGTNLMKCIHTISDKCPCPVVLMSGRRDARCFEENPKNIFLKKPFTFEQLSEVLENAFGRHV